jgi:hypothetical protein
MEIHSFEVNQVIKLWEKEVATIVIEVKELNTILKNYITR